MSNGKLFCLAYREQLSLKCSVISNHVNSSKHNAGKARLKNKQQAEMELAEALKSYDAMKNPKGVTLSNEQRIYRIKVVRTFLLVGMPLNKFPAFRELLEEHAYRLSDRRHMSDLVPSF